MPGSIYHELVAASRGNVPFALGLIARVKGSSPQKQGAKAIFYSDGRMFGTLGGGCLEAEIRKQAFEVMKNGEGRHFSLVLDHDFGWDDGLICGGKVSCVIVPEPQHALDLWEEIAPRETVITWGVRSDYVIERATGDSVLIYRETVAPREQLWIAGAGHVAQAVAPLACKLNFSVSVFDDRPALANRSIFPGEIGLRVDYWEKLLAESVPASTTLGLILTRGHQHDALVLSRWIHRPFVFLGMIGSKRKKTMIFSHFVAEGIAEANELERVVCPVGIPIGGTSVDEIAISIVAQLVQDRAMRQLPETTKK